MRFDIISLFPESFTSYFGVSILKRAQEAGLIEIHTHQLRDFTHDKHRTVDDTPYGGGAGMVLKVEPIAEALQAVRKMQDKGYRISDKGGKVEEKNPITHHSSIITHQQKTRVILFSAKGKIFTQDDAKRLATYDRLILLCGRYEGVDERVAEHLVDEELSIGEYVLTGGEIPALVMVDAVTRLIPGVLGNAASTETESHSIPGVLEYPQYTKPEEWQDMRVPEVLLSGHHGQVAAWRKEKSSQSTKNEIKESA